MWIIRINRGEMGCQPHSLRPLGTQRAGFSGRQRKNSADQRSGALAHRNVGGDRLPKAHRSVKVLPNGRRAVARL